MILVAVVSVVLALGGCAGQHELLNYGGFEQKSNFQKTPGDWYPTIMPATQDFVDFEWDDQVAYSGNRSVSIAIDPAHPEDEIAYNWTKAVAGCEEGRTYELSGWVKAENLNGPAWICVQCWDDTFSDMLAFATTQKDWPITGTLDWAQVGTVFTVPAGTAEVRIRAGIASPDNRGGRVWFDGLSVRLLE
jgi:hypothetical protein